MFLPVKHYSFNFQKNLIMNNNTNNQSMKSFVDSFKSVSKNLATRYSINMHLDFIQEFIKFADNTRDIDLQDAILAQIMICEDNIINIIKNYENHSNNSKDIN